MTKTAKENNGFQLCFAAIDNSTKYDWGIPTTNNDRDNCIEGSKNAIET